MIKFFQFLPKIFEILSTKNKILFVLFFINSIFLAILETFSIGILALYVGFLSNTELVLDKITIDFIKNYLITLDKATLILSVSIVIVIAFVLKNICVVFSGWFSRKIKQSILSENSKEIFSYILLQDFKNLINTPKSVLTYKVYNEIKRVVNLIEAYSAVLKEVLLIFLIASSLFFIDKSIFVILVIVFLLFFVISVKIFKGMIKRFANLINKHSSLMLKSVSEIIDNSILIKLSSKNNFFIKKYISQLNLQQKFMNLDRLINSLPKSIFEILGVSLVMGYVLFEIIYGNKNTNELITTISFVALAAARMIPSFGQLNLNVSTLIFNENTFLEFCNSRKEMNFFRIQKEENYENTIIKEEKKLEIVLSNMSFYYDEQSKVLENLSYNFSNDCIYGISGKSGSGKSTLIKIIMGLLEPLKGGVYISDLTNKYDIRKHKSIFGYVPQNIFLINDTIESNIALGENQNEIKSVEMKKSLELTSLSELLNITEVEKYKISEQGANLSGGQTQMIGIARAIYRNPKILILDEPTNNLDSITKKKFIQNLKKISENRICIIVSHDTELLKCCNKNISISEGKLIEK